MSNDLDDLANRISALETAALLGLQEQRRLAYQHAGEWVRMVNTITWTLTSIFLVGAVIALNGAMQKNPEDDVWTHKIGWCVVGLSAIWLAVDIVYEWTAIRARTILQNLEGDENWQGPKLYTDQVTGVLYYVSWLMVFLIWATPIALGIFALMYFALK
jgi:hypothetical protein